MVVIHSGKDWLCWAKGKDSLHNGGFSMNYRLLTVAQQPVQFVQWLSLPGGGDRSSALKNLLIINNRLLLLDYSVFFLIDPLLFQIKYKKISSAFFKKLFVFPSPAWTWMKALQKQKNRHNSGKKNSDVQRNGQFKHTQFTFVGAATLSRSSRTEAVTDHIKMALFYSSVLMNRDSVRVSQRARNHDPENEAAKWNVTAINLIIHTCTRSGPNVLSGKRGFGAKDKNKTVQNEPISNSF